MLWRVACLCTTFSTLVHAHGVLNWPRPRSNVWNASKCAGCNHYINTSDDFLPAGRFATHLAHLQLGKVQPDFDSCGEQNWLDCYAGQHGTNNMTQALPARAFMRDRPCGGPENDDPGPEPPVVTLIAGQRLDVEWLITIGIAHSFDFPGGVRLALSFGPDDSFDDNVLAGALPGSPEMLSSGPADILANRSGGDLTFKYPVHHSVMLPSKKTCDLCVLQFMWFSPNSHGLYLSCADVIIKEKA